MAFSGLLDFIFIRSKVKFNLLRSSEPGAYLNYNIMEWIQFTYDISTIYNDTKNIKIILQLDEQHFSELSTTLFFRLRWVYIEHVSNRAIFNILLMNSLSNTFSGTPLRKKIEIKMMIHIYKFRFRFGEDPKCKSKAEGKHLQIINHQFVRKYIKK